MPVGIPGQYQVQPSNTTFSQMRLDLYFSTVYISLHPFSTLQDVFFVLIAVTEEATIVTTIWAALSIITAKCLIPPVGYLDQVNITAKYIDKFLIFICHCVACKSLHDIRSTLNAPDSSYVCKARNVHLIGGTSRTNYCGIAMDFMAKFGVLMSTLSYDAFT